MVRNSGAELRFAAIFRPALLGNKPRGVPASDMEKGVIPGESGRIDAAFIRGVI